MTLQQRSHCAFTRQSALRKLPIVVTSPVRAGTPVPDRKPASAPAKQQSWAVCENPIPTRSQLDRMRPPVHVRARADRDNHHTRGAVPHPHHASSRRISRRLRVLQETQALKASSEPQRSAKRNRRSSERHFVRIPIASLILRACRHNEGNGEFRSLGTKEGAAAFRLLKKPVSKTRGLSPGISPDARVPTLETCNYDIQMSFTQHRLLRCSVDEAERSP